MKKIEGKVKEAVAVVLVYKYKKILDDIKRKVNTPEMLMKGQIVELDLLNLTKDVPVAKKYLDEVINYRREKSDKIIEVKMPAVEEIPIVVVQKVSEPPAVKPIEKPAEPATVEKKEEDYPFDF